MSFKRIIDRIFSKYGYDFRHYAPASIERRISYCMNKNGFTSHEDFSKRICSDRDFFDQVLPDLFVSVTEFFRDPELFLAIRKRLISVLKTYPFINIWHAGCATGEEVYSMAMLLHDEGLLKRSRIYATDFNSDDLRIAAKGFISLNNYERLQHSYHKSGGTNLLSHFYTPTAQGYVFKNSLKTQIHFARHNLIQDNNFATMHLIFCRNVMIYFDRQVQNKLLESLSNALINRGFLCIGLQESIEGIPSATSFESFESREKIYRKKSTLAVETCLTS